MKSRLLMGAVFLVMLTVLGTALLTRPVPSSPGTPLGGGSVSASGTYTMADVAQHNNASSCWAAINGNVYDLTNWINQHPGGPQRILMLCGTDGSAAFNGKHGGQARPASELANFLLGPLVS